MMKRIIVALVMAGTFFGSAGAVRAADVAEEPFISISITPDTLDLGTMLFLSTSNYSEPAPLTIKVDSNCMHGPILASMSELKHYYRGDTIKPDRVFVKAPVTDGFVSMAKPVIISEPTMGPHDIELSFRVENSFNNAAGKYSGTIVFTVMPP